MLKRDRPESGRNVWGVLRKDFVYTKTGDVAKKNTLCCFFAKDGEVMVKTPAFSIVKQLFLSVRIPLTLHSLFAPVWIVKRGKNPSLDKHPVWLDKYHKHDKLMKEWRTEYE